MKKTVSVVLAALVLFHASCAYGRTADREASQIQREIASAVLIEQEVSVMPGPSILSKLPKTHAPITPRTLQASGSGVVFFQRKVDGKVHSLVATADHVCFPEENFPIELTALGRKTTVTGTAGDEHDGVPGATVVYRDSVHDVCVLDVPGAPAKVAPVMREDPPLGARVFIVGALGGRNTFGHDLMLVQEGIFSGIKHDETSDWFVMSGTSYHGASGGAVYYRGQVVTVLVHISTQYGHAPQAVDPAAFRLAVRTSLRLWLNQHKG